MSSLNLKRNIRDTNWVIPDPGDAGEIPSNEPGICNLISEGAETRTLPDPVSEYQPLLLAMETDGGDIVITVANAYDNAGSTTITFDDAGDYVALQSIKVGSDFRWRLVGSDGVLGPSVELSSGSIDTLTVDTILNIAKDVEFTGATGVNQITVPTNLADALSIIDSAGDLIVIDTTTGTQVLTITPPTTFVGIVTGPEYTFNGSTGANKTTLPTNLADAWSILDSAADIIVFDTTTGTPVITFTPITTFTGVITASAGIKSTAQTVVPDAVSGAASLITAGVTNVVVDTVTNDADDWITLPSLADVPDGHTITILCNAGSNFELQTPGTDGEEINSEDCDGTKEYLCTDTEIIKVIKVDDTIGWMAHAFSQIGAVVAAVVPHSP